MRLCMTLLFMFLASCATTKPSVEDKISDLQLQTENLGKAISLIEYRTEFYRFDVGVDQCQANGEICKLKSPSKSDTCQKDMESCVINLYRHWKKIKEIKNWK